MKDRVGWFFVGFCAGALFSVLGTGDISGDAWMQALGAGIALGVLSAWLVPQILARPERRHTRKRLS
jgi:Kef-type K+ transport system membrane component KefB